MNARREWPDAALGRYVLANPQQAADTVTVVQFMRWLSTERVQCPAKSRNGQLCDREEGHSGLHHWPIDSGRAYTEHPTRPAKPVNTKPCDRCGQLEEGHKDVGFCRDYWVNRRPLPRYTHNTKGEPLQPWPADRGKDPYPCSGYTAIGSSKLPCCNCGHTWEDHGICRASTRGLECDCPGTVCRSGSR